MVAISHYGDMMSNSLKPIAITSILSDNCCGPAPSLKRNADINAAEAVLPGDDVIYKTTEIFSALADSTRLKILTALMSGELCVCELQEVCGVSQSAVSHQLRLLRDRGLVRARRDGQRSLYWLADDHVSELISVGIEHAIEGLPARWAALASEPANVQASA
jgi:ArsR family transcriptional regulator